MTAIVPVSAELSISLFDQASQLMPRRGQPGDGIYRDYMLGSALGHLAAALRAETSKDRLEECAESIEICCALSSVMRTHLASLVRSVAAGELQPQSAIEVVTVARSRIFHQIAVDHLRTIGADGLDSLADAVDGLTDAVGKAKR